MAYLSEIVSDSDSEKGEGDNVNSGIDDSGSDFSFHDSDNNLDDDEDDILFQNNGDIGVEFVGVGSSPSVKLNGLELPCPKELPVIDDEDFNEGSCGESENLRSLEGSTDEEDCLGGRRRRSQRFNVAVDKNEPKLKIGMIFANRVEFKEAVKATAICEVRNVWFPCNEPGRVRAKCRGLNCDWFVYATKCVDGSFQIRTLNLIHNCGCALNSKHVNSTVLSTRYAHQLKLNSSMRAIDLQEQVLHDLHVSISRRQAYRTIKKGKALDELQFLDQYSLLNNYCAELVRTNPGSTVFLKTEEDELTGEQRFLRFYCCLEPLKRGFKAGCRKVVGLDGCHLKGPHPGVILTAVGMDANNCIYPVCYSVVETENLETWRWFVGLLVDDLGIDDPEMWVFVTDKQKGLGIALEELLPDVEHRHCVRHLHQNFKKKHGSFALKDKMWEAARATYVERFTSVMEVIRVMDEAAYEWLAKEPPRYWTRSHFRTNTHCDVLLNNMCESWNKQLLDARESTILVCLERIRVYLVERLEKRRKWIGRWQGVICPKIRKIINLKKKWSSKWIPLHCGGSTFQIKGPNGAQFAVDLNTFNCACRGWDLSGIPCVHVISALASSGLEAEDYTSDFFKTSTFKKAYEPYIAPINGPELWPQTNGPKVIAPKGVKLAGRPKKKRDRAVGEDVEERMKKSRAKDKGKEDVRVDVQKFGRHGLKGKCSSCKQLGHNIRSCSRKSEGQSAAESVVNDPVKGNSVDDQITETPKMVSEESQGQSSSVVKVDKRRSSRLKKKPKVSENNVYVNATNSDVNINVVNSDVNVEALRSYLQVTGCKSKVDVDIDASEVHLDVNDSNIVVTTQVVSPSRKRPKSRAKRCPTPSKTDVEDKVDGPETTGDAKFFTEMSQTSKSTRGNEEQVVLMTQGSTNEPLGWMGPQKKRERVEGPSKKEKFTPNKKPCVEVSKFSVPNVKDAFLPTGVKNLGQPSDKTKRPPFRPGGIGVHTRAPTPISKPGAITIGTKKIEGNPFLYKGKQNVSLEMLKSKGKGKSKGMTPTFDVAGVNEAFKVFDKNMADFMKNLFNRGSSSKQNTKIDNKDAFTKKDNLLVEKEKQNAVVNIKAIAQKEENVGPSSKEKRGKTVKNQLGVKKKGKTVKLVKVKKEKM